MAGNLIGSGTAISNLNYSNIINPSELTLYNVWTKIGNDVYNTSGDIGRLGVGIIPSSTFEIYKNPGPYKIKGGGSSFGVNRSHSNGYFRFLSSYSSDLIATFHDVNYYDNPTTDTLRFSISTTWNLYIK